MAQGGINDKYDPGPVIVKFWEPLDQTIMPLRMANAVIAETFGDSTIRPQQSSPKNTWNIKDTCHESLYSIINLRLL